MTTIHPLPFQGDLIDHLKLNGRTLEWLWRDGEAYIPARPICEMLGVDWKSQHRRLTAAETEAVVVMMTTTGADGKRYEMLCVAYPDFLWWLGNLTPSRVKEEAREALRTLRREIKTLIAAHYHDRMFGEMAAYRQAHEKAAIEIVFRRPIYIMIREGVGYGWTFEQIWRSGSWSRPKLAEAVDYLYRLGAINRLPDGMPARQTDLFSHA